jgi:hypothetical protein
MASVNAQKYSNTHPVKCRYKRRYNLAAVSFDGDGETGQRTGFILGSMASHSLAESFLSTRTIVFSTMKLKMLMVRLPKTRLYQFTDTVNILLKFLLEAGPQIELFLKRNTMVCLVVLRILIILIGV